jgi:hypothetical protein
MSEMQNGKCEGPRAFKFGFIHTLTRQLRRSVSLAEGFEYGETGIRAFTETYGTSLCTTRWSASK